MSRTKKHKLTGAKAVSHSCGNHGSCEWCRSNRTYNELRDKEKAEYDEKEFRNEKAMTQGNINSLIYQDSNAYQIGRKDGYDEIMSQMSDIIGKCYNTGYKDAMDFVCEWLYIYYPTIERCNSAEEAWKHLEKAMKENLL